MGKMNKLREELAEGRSYMKDLADQGLETPEHFAIFCKEQDIRLSQELEAQRLAMQEYRAAHLDRARMLTREAQLRWREKHWVLTKVQRTARYAEARARLRGQDEAQFRAWLGEMRGLRSNEWIQHLPLYGIARFEADMNRAEPRAWDYYREHADERARLLAEYFDPAPGNELLTKEAWISLRIASRFRCFYCGVSSNPARLQRDHRTPLSNGGRHCARNVVPACRSCNQKKGIQSFETFLMSSVRELL